MSIIYDLRGKKFGRLTCIEPIKKDNKRCWICKCDCGKEYIVPTYQLTGGYTSSCGCIRTDKRDEYIGKRFGNLIVESFYGRDRKNIYNMFYCLCDCGNYKVVSARNLQRGSTTHCGCKKVISHSNRKQYGESTKNTIISSYRHNAKNKNLNFELSNDDIENLFKQNCYYCGDQPSRVANKKKSYGEYIYNGIDRKNNSLGYVYGNVVSCCTRCNYMKNTYSDEEFLSIIRKIYNNIYYSKE